MSEIGELVNRWIGKFNSPIHRFTNTPIYQFTNQLTNSPIHQPTNLLSRYFTAFSSFHHDTWPCRPVVWIHGRSAPRAELAGRMAARARGLRDRCGHRAVVSPRGFSRRLQLV